MHNLLNFLVKNSYWFVFIFLEIICCYFIFSENSYQRSVFLNSSNEISGRIYASTSNVTSYFGLKNENQSLLEQNGILRDRIAHLEKHIFDLEKDSLKTQAYLDSDYESDNEYVAARVINNSVSQAHNFITIDKGSKNGIEVGMGVVSHLGVVGEVRAVSDNFSVVQSLLNPDSRYSSKIKSTNAFSPIEWINMDSRYVTMREYPSYEKVQVGDTVVTSGYSDVFPSDVLVGIVSDYTINHDLNQYEITVELSTDFNSLKNVLVVKRSYLEEKQKLENSVANAKN